MLMSRDENRSIWSRLKGLARTQRDTVHRRPDWRGQAQPQRSNLDGIAQRRAGAVHADEGHVSQCQARCCDCGLDEGRLRRPVWRREPRRATSLIVRGPCAACQGMLTVSRT